MSCKIEVDESYQPLISIVTVVFNGASVIEETINNVAEQTYRNIEYIIVDGGSTDGTLALLEKNKHKIDLCKSELDKGIFDAMNKGVNLCKGDWVIFMNAGDTFYSPTTLQNFVLLLKTKTADLVFGNVLMIYPGGNEQERQLYNSIPFLIRNMICHQCIFYSRKALAVAGEFDTRYRLTSDFDHFLRIKYLGLHIKKIDLIIARYKLDGVSAEQKNIVKIWKERLAILPEQKNMPVFMRAMFYMYAKLAFWYRK
jgi:glycosyltransferase involved in cell wall biosynthesis